MNQWTLRQIATDEQTDAVDRYSGWMQWTDAVEGCSGQIQWTDTADAKDGSMGNDM